MNESNERSAIADRWLRRLTRGAWASTAVVALFLVSGLAAAIPRFPPAPSAPAAPFASVGTPLALSPHTASPPVLLPHTLAPPGASGRGTFFVNHPQPSPPNPTCILGSLYSYPANGCYNVTNDPSLVYSPTGTMAVAYTALTNASMCPANAGNTTSMIGFSTSANAGATWSKPRYLGNPTCTGGDLLFPDAWQPTLTTLPNGTIAMAYVQYNLTNSTYWHPLAPDVGCDYTTY